MSKQYPGGLITKTPVTPNSISAPGVWSLSDQAKAQATNTWPFPRDPQFNYVTMLLHGDGSAGAVPMGSGAGVSTTVTNFNADASTNNFNVTINGDARSNNFNPYQSGYYGNYFNGSSYLAISNGGGSALDMGTGNCTIEMWVNPATQTTSFPSMFAPASSWSTGTFYIRYSDTSNPNKFGIFWNSVGDPFFVSTNTYAPNAWYHVALVRSGTTFTLYINGVADGTGTSSASLNLAIGGSVWLGNNGSASCNFTGYLSNVRVVKGTAVYTSNFTPSTTPLTAISGTSLLTAQSNRFIDTSSNALAITTSGSPQVSPVQPFTLPSSVATYGSGYFDGSGDYLNGPTNTAFAFGTGDFTISAWVFIANGTSSQIIWTNQTTSSANAPNLVFFILNNNVCIANTNTAHVASSGTIANNTWAYVGVTRVSGTYTFYINGSTSGTTGTIGTDNITENACRIGYGNYGTNYYFGGYIADLRVIKGSAVTPTVPTSPLTAVSGTSLLTTQYNGGGNNSGFKDSSQNNYLITRYGNTTQGTFTPYGSNWSNYFDGSSYLQTSSSQIVPTGSFTVECMVYVTDTSNQGFVAQGTTGNAARFAIAIDGGLWWAQIGSANVNVGTPVVNTWTYLAATFNGSTLTLYVNGVSVGTASTTTSAQNTTLAIGTYGSGWVTTSYFTKGYISNVRISNTVRTITTPTIPYSLDSNTNALFCQSNRFKDSSSNNYTINIQSGTPSVQSFSPFAPLTVYNPSVNGGSAYFDGAGSYDYLQTAGKVGIANQSFTICCWFYPLNSSVIGLFDSGPNVAGCFRNYTVNTIEDQTGTPSVSVSFAGAYKVNAWNWMCITKSGTSFTVYINGTSVGTGVCNLSMVETNFTVGGINNGGDGVYYGYISDFQVLNIAAVVPVPTAPITNASNKTYLLNFQNAGILDNAMMNELETVGNASVSTSVVKYGAASMYFDGSSDRLYEPSSQNFNFGTGDFTIELWANPISQGGHGSSNNDCLIDFRPATGGGAYGTLYIYNSGASVNWYANTAARIVGGTISNGAWTHIAICRSSGSTRLFLNGVQSGSTYADSTNYLVSPITIGEFNDGTSGGNFYGYMDDIRITKGYARYTTTFTPPTQAFPNG